MNQVELIGIGDVMHRARTSRDTVIRYTTDLEIQPVLTPGGHRRYRVEDATRLVKAILAPRENPLDKIMGEPGSQ